MNGSRILAICSFVVTVLTAGAGLLAWINPKYAAMALGAAALIGHFTERVQGGISKTDGIEQKGFISVGLCLLLALGSLGGALASKGCSKNQTDTALRLEGDSAKALTGIAKIIREAENNGQISDADALTLREPLKEIHSGLQLAKNISVEQAGQPPSQSQRERLFDALDLAMDAVSRLNSAGLLHLKNENVKASFTVFITMLQSAISGIRGVVAYSPVPFRVSARPVALVALVNRQTEFNSTSPN